MAPCYYTNSKRSTSSRRHSSSDCMGLIALLVTSLFRPPALVESFSARIPSAIGRTAAFVSVSTSSPSSSSSSHSSSRRFTDSKSRLYSADKSFLPFLADVASSIMGGNDSKFSETGPKVDAALEKLLSEQHDNIPSWTGLRAQLESQMTTPEERTFRDNVEYGYGVMGSPLHKVRLFDPTQSEEADVRVTFYRDSASWCPYCQKVWMALEELKIPYRVEKINMRCYGEKPASFQRLQPSGNIPVAIIDGQQYGQSNDILYTLASPSFSTGAALMPPKGQEMRAQELLRLERTLFSSWMYWLTGGGGPTLKGRFVDTLEQVEDALAKAPQGGPFFLGPKVSIVDVMFAPFLERMAASLLYYKGFMMRAPPGTQSDYPNLNKWFDAMETLPSYQLTKSDYYTHCWDLPPQLGGCVSEPAGEPYRQAIDGEGTSWKLPLEPHNGGVEPDWAWAASDEAFAKREAVERVTFNHEAIAKFAARGAGRKGMPGYSAPLADPNAVPNDAVQNSVDTVLRIMCHKLLSDESSSASSSLTLEKPYEQAMSAVATLIVEQGGEDFADGVIASIAYMRDRVGVPRDMKLPAARQLRAHANWAMDVLLAAKN